MNCEIDVRKLRRDIMDNYGTAMCSGFPMAAIDLAKVESLSDYELVEYAKRNGVDLRPYIL